MIRNLKAERCLIHLDIHFCVEKFMKRSLSYLSDIFDHGNLFLHKILYVHYNEKAIKWFVDQAVLARTCLYFLFNSKNTKEYIEIWELFDCNFKYGILSFCFCNFTFFEILKPKQLYIKMWSTTIFIFVVDIFIGICN